MLPSGDPLLTTPDCDDFIAKCFVELGLSCNNGHAETPIKWTEIKAYDDLLSLELTPYQAEMIALMSREYLSYKSKATINRGMKSPHQPEVTKEQLCKRAAHFEKLTENESP